MRVVASTSPKSLSCRLASSVARYINMYGNLKPAEIEFLAEKQVVKITPKFTQNQVIYLISGNLGPFISGVPVEVPLWLAIHLKRRQKCEITLPDWLSIEQLEEKKQAEAESEYFTSPPSPHYMELSQLLLQHAVDDVPKADQIRTLVKDIWDVRLAKLRTSLNLFMTSDAMVAKVNNLTLLEINSVQTFLSEALSCRQKLKGHSNMNVSTGDSQIFDSINNTATDSTLTDD